jgi:6-phosphogluconate dehydrogenase (decarboxylating)
MKIGMVGLGKMGANMTARLVGKGHEVVAFDVSAEARAAAAGRGAATAERLEDLVAALEPPRAVWVMVPSGEPTRSVIETLKGLLEQGDVVIDGGNSNYKEAAPTPLRWPSAASDSSTPAPRVGYGDWPTATASWSAATRRQWPCASRR